MLNLIIALAIGLIAGATIGFLYARTKDNSQDLNLQMTLLREQLKTSTETVLKERTAELAHLNNEQLARILNPFQQDMRHMQEAVEKSRKEHTEGMTRLDESIKHTMQQANLIGERADRLANALTKENKAQGNFGELRLRQLLENMGLEPGEQFSEQEVLRDESGRAFRNEESGATMQPDFILHFPDERDVVIDAKMSLLAFEQYHNATVELEKERALKDHIRSVRDHVSELAKKNYSKYITKGRTRIDYVIMYVPYESAFQLALQTDPDLYRWAFSQNVMITSTQNMYALLRMIEISWRQQRQVENQENIIKAANTMIDRVQLFYERFLGVQENLKKTQESFDSLGLTLKPEGKSIITSANQIITYGAKKPKASKPSIKTFDTVEDMDALTQ